MRRVLALTMLSLSLVASAHYAHADLNDVAKALGAPAMKSIQYSGSGGVFAPGQSSVPGLPWPEYNLKSYTRSANYDTASLRDEQVRTQALDLPRSGGLQALEDGG